MAKKEVKQAPAKAKKAAAEAKPFTGEPRLKVKYRETAIPGLKEKFHYENVMMIPKLDKIIINMGLGSEKDNPKGIETAVAQLSAIAGQAAVVTKAKKSVANFKVREGMTIGAKVTLRGDKMYYFADKLMNIVRRPRQLRHGRQGAADLPRDQLRRCGQGARHEHRVRHQRQDR